MNDAADAHPEAGAIQGGEAASDASGMSVEDAATSAYDDADRRENGIAEGERENLGQYLKGHADSAGVSVIAGLDSLIQPAVALRHGNIETKREVIGRIVDDYGVQPMPLAEPEPLYNDVPTAEPAGAEQPATADEQIAVISDFIARNPVAQDQRVQSNMVAVLDDMARQGFEPNLETAFQHAVAADSRYSESARQSQAQAEEAAHLARAKTGTGQISGGGSTAPSSPSDDLDAIIREQF